MSRTLTQIAQAIRSHSSFLVGGHKRPDGDAIGSALGLRLALSRLGKRVVTVARSGVPRHYRFLPGADQVQRDAPATGHEVVIAVDCDGRDRFDGPPGALESAEVVINIDHHAGTPDFGDIRLVEPGRAAVGEMILSLLDELRVPLDAAIATCLYCAIGTDTGFFRFANATPSAFEAAARLVRAGADPQAIAAKSWEEKPLAAMTLLGRALASLEPLRDGRLLVAELGPQDYAASGAQSEDSEGIIERIKFTAGSQVATLLRDEGRGEVHVSLRSTNGLDVATVARKFGGGGHPTAAGCTLRGDLATARAALLPELEAILEEAA